MALVVTCVGMGAQVHTWNWKEAEFVHQIVLLVYVVRFFVRFDCDWTLPVTGFSGLITSF